MAAMLVTAGVTNIALDVKLRCTIGQTKVKRYWPGKAPDWADDADDDEDGDIQMTSADDALQKPFPDVVRKDDRRLRRLAESKIHNPEEVRADHLRIRQAEIISTEEEQECADMEEQDEEALQERRRRRRRIKEKSPLREQQQEEAEEVEEEEEEEESDSDSEEETTMVKSIFVPKAERETIAERERLEDEERALEKKKKRKLEERKVETKQILVEEINKDQLIQKNLEMEASVADADTDDEVNEAEEYEAWKVREIVRIKRDRDREAPDKYKNPTQEAPASKKKWNFTQKYYHHGAFFQDHPDDIAACTAPTYDICKRRDVSAPTGDDKMNKSRLPKVRRVKDFGRSGRTKWTHLVNEDTTFASTIVLSSDWR